MNSGIRGRLASRRQSQPVARGAAQARLDTGPQGNLRSLRSAMPTRDRTRTVRDPAPVCIGHRARVFVYSVVSEMSEQASLAEKADRSLWFHLNTQFHNALLEPADSYHMRALQNSRGLISASDPLPTATSGWSTSLRAPRSRKTIHFLRRRYEAIEDPRRRL
jgi:hypothetical protein